MAGFKDIHTGKIEDIMLVKTAADIERFKKIYGIEGSIDKSIRMENIMELQNRLNNRRSMRNYDAAKKVYKGAG